MNPLRNPNINYRQGWFFVTFQVAMNKSVFGVIDGKRLVHNVLGRMVDENLRGLGGIFKELFIDTCVVMPNHVHAVIKITPQPRRAGGHDIARGDGGYDIAQGAGGHDIAQGDGGHDIAQGDGRYDIAQGDGRYDIARRDGRYDIARRDGGRDIAQGDGGREKDLAYFIGRFKSFTTNQYHKSVKAGECIDIGPRLWNENFYDNLISSHRELEAVRRYTLRNPERWEDDRFGAVTTYAIGNAELLNLSMVAFVASDTHDDWSKGRPHLREIKEWPRGTHRGVPPTIGCGHGGPHRTIWDGHGGVSPTIGYGHRGPTSTIGSDNGGPTRTREDGHGGPNIVRGGSPYPPLISTFTSFEEQGALARSLAQHRPFVWVMPGGIREPLPQRVATACAEGWGLVVSPVPGGTGVNKQRAIWCNRYVLRMATRIFTGTITRGGTLDTLLQSMQGTDTE